MFDLFSDILARRDNFLAKMDPRPKLLISLSLVMTVVLSTRVRLPLAVLGACVAVMCWLRVPLRLACMRLLGPLGILLVLLILQAFFTKGAPILEWNPGGLHLVATKEGLDRGFLLACRGLAGVCVLMLLGFVTPAYRVFHALRWLRVPEGWVETAMLVYRYVFALLEEVAEVAAAQRVRLGYSSFRRSMVSFGVLAGTVIVRSMDQAFRTYEAMKLRGYKDRIPFAALPPMNTRDKWCTMLGPLVLGLVFLAVEACAP